ncbi:MAG: LPP20 family lipoprotein, partial [Prevotella sp.]|nr:LPP20 family lipoprotein [Prevotella sp.]
MIITFSLFSILIFSQVNKENEKRACELQASSEYICGLGHGNTLKQASNDALAALSSQISTTVSSDFNYLVNSESNGDDVKESVKVDNIIRTYSHTTL